MILKQFGTGVIISTALIHVCFSSPPFEETDTDANAETEVVHTRPVHVQQ